MCCLIAVPLNYKLSIRWPRSRNEICYNNVPYIQFLADKGGENWIKRGKDTLRFIDGNIQSSRSAHQYFDLIGAIVDFRAGPPIPELSLLEDFVLSTASMFQKEMNKALATRSESGSGQGFQVVLTGYCVLVCCADRLFVVQLGDVRVDWKLLD